MTMNITLELTPEMEARLREGITQHDADTVRQVLHEAVEPTARVLLGRKHRLVSVEEAERLLDQLVQDVESQLPPDWKGLSDYAVSREGIYEDHT